MKIMVCANVLSNFSMLKKDAEFCEADKIFIAGNVGIEYDTEFSEYIDEKININQWIYYVTGKYEDFYFVKEIKDNDRNAFFFLEPYGKFSMEDEFGSFRVAGVSGTYSPTFYEKETAPLRHMTRKQLFSVPQNTEIVLLHNVPGKVAKSGSLDFHDDVFNFIKEKTPKYIFIGGYDRFSHFSYDNTTVLFLNSLQRGYAILETKDWSCLYQNKML